jgi:hypothetical protein
MTTEGFHNNSGEEGISLKKVIKKLIDWWRYLLSKWIPIFMLGLLGSILGFTYAYFNKPIYTATTTFVLEAGENSNGLGQYSGLASMVGIDLSGGGGGIFQGDNILELYKSRAMIQKTLLTEITFQGKKELLVDRYIDFNRLRKSWKKDPSLINIEFKRSETLTRLQDSILGSIVSDINKQYLNVLKPDKKQSIIRADVRSTNEFFAKEFNDQIVKNVNDFYIQTKTKKSVQNVQILQRKTDSVRRVMNGAIYTASEIVDETPNLNPTRQTQRVAPMQRSQFNAETNKAILGELLKNLEMSKLALLKELPLIQVVDTPVYPLEKQKFGKLKGIILGGFIAIFFTTLILIFKKIIKSTMN